MNLFDVVPVLEKLTIQDVLAAAKDLIDESRMTVCQVVPKQ